MAVLILLPQLENLGLEADVCLPLMFLELLFADQTNLDGDQSGFLVKELYQHVKAHLLSSTEVQTSVPPLNIVVGTDVEGEHAPCCRGPDG